MFLAHNHKEAHLWNFKKSFCFKKHLIYLLWSNAAIAKLLGTPFKLAVPQGLKKNEEKEKVIPKSLLKKQKQQQRDQKEIKLKPEGSN
jgi:hypothetical protein